MRVSLFSKLMVSYLLVSLVTLTVVGIVISQLFANYIYSSKAKELERKGQEMARIVAAYMEINQAQNVDFMLNALGTFIDARLVAIDKETLKQTATGHGILQLWLTEEDAARVLRGEVLSKKGFSKQTDQQQAILSTIVPVLANGEVSGAIILAAPVSGLTATVKAVRLLIIYAAAGVIVLSIMLGLWLSRSISRPLRQMSAVTRAMAEGNFRQRVAVNSGDEVGRLAEDFNNLAGSLDHTISALSREKDKLENILTNMTESVLAIDRRGNVILANEAFYHTMQVTPIEILDHPVSKISGCPGLAELFADVAGSGEHRSSEFEMNGGKLIVLAHLAPLREAGGNSYGAVGVLQDITELRKLEHLRREFVANVSHELRTPLTSIQGFLEALLDGTIDESRGRERYLKIIHRETLRLSRLIHDLLDLSLIESGKVNWELNPIDTQSLVSRVMLKLSPQMEQQKVEVVANIPDNLPLMLGNEDRIEQVLINLVENAVRFSPPESTITVLAAAGNGNITIKVNDQGPGIPPDDLPYIWERFHRVEKSRSRNLGGTGLGLAIVRQIIEAHGGQVEVQSNGSGSTFSFVLPAVPAEE